jgi:DNA polymerase I-like protein with 3'-5' exonuclease and polymerase domains
MSSNKDLLDSMLSNYVPLDQAFPPVADWHSANTLAMFREEFRESYYNNPLKFKSLRGLGKSTGLAMGYGGTEYTVSENLGIPKDEAGALVSLFKSGVPHFIKYCEDKIAEAKKEKVCRDMFGRIRYIPMIESKRTGDKEIDKQNFKNMLRGERLALNAPIQMTGATQIKLITINIGKFIEENRLNFYHGNLMNNYKPYHRVVYIKESEVTTGLISAVDDMPDGNVMLIVINDENKVISMMDKPKQIKYSFIEQNNLSILV